MNPTLPWALRAQVVLFRALVALLPEAFRAEWMAGAHREVERLLAEARERRGTVVAVWTGVCACWDVARAIPREWWRTRQRRLEHEASLTRLGMGERMMNWMKELRQAGRALARRPGFTATAVTTLGLGIGATVAIFTVVNAVILRPLPYPDSDRLVAVNHHAPALNLPTLSNSAGTLNFYWAQGDFLEGLAAYDSQQRNLIGGPQPERVAVVAASPQIFDVLGVQPAVGRPFNEADAQPGATSVMLLTHAAWMGRFGGDRDILGRTMEVDGVTTEIVGVMPPGFAFPDPRSVALLPLYVDPDGSFGQFGTEAVGRLAPGFDLARAQVRATELQNRLPEFTGDIDQAFLDRAGWSVSVERFQDVLVGDDVASALWVVLATVGFVFLIACANVANLFLVRAESRQKEVAVRAAMGAGYRRIASGFLSESLVLGVGGGILGVFLAWLGVDLLVRGGPEGIPRIDEVAMDAQAVAVAAGLSVLAALVFGAFPLVRFAGGGVASLLRDGGRANTHGKERHRTRSALVAAQLALALVLLVGSGLMFRSFKALSAVDVGVEPEDVLTVGMSLGENVDLPEAARFYEEVADQVAALPGVSSVGLSTLVPVGGGGANGGSFFIESKPREEEALPPVAMYKAVGHDYLEATGQKLLKGRELTRADWEGDAPVVMVNESFEKQFLDGNALGERIRWGESVPWAEVVGVVADARELDLRDEPGAWAYLPMVLRDWGTPALERNFLFVRTAPGQSVSAAPIREIVARLNPNVPITSVRTLEDVMSEEMAGMSFTMALLGIAALVALFLGAIGLFGVISYVVAQRTREIGVRVALGAQHGDIRSMVFRQSAGVATVGVALGLIGAALLTRLMGSLLYGVSSLDPMSFLVAPVVLVGVAVTATWLPARKATKVDPVVALRSE